MSDLTVVIGQSEFLKWKFDSPASDAHLWLAQIKKALNSKGHFVTDVISLLRNSGSIPVTVIKDFDHAPREAMFAIELSDTLTRLDGTDNILLQRVV